jgi:hypothetical protein
MRAKRRLSMKTLVIAILCVFAGALVRAQIAGNGEVQGTITDSSGAVVPGASVVATNAATGAKMSTMSTGAGLYVLSPLTPGDYTVTVEAKGFRTLVQQHLTVNALTVTGLNLTLQVGTSTQEVTVTAAPPALNTTNGTLGITIDNRAYTALPLAMSNGPLATDGIITLLPGVKSFPLAGAGFTFNGGEADTNEIYINGLPAVNNQTTGMDQPLDDGFSVETIDQFQIDTNGTPAMYQGQGSENFELKSGTNQIHGDLYEYVRNTAFDAAGYFNSTTPIEKQNEFGGSIGGPIFKNRIFYFGNYDGYRLRELAQFAYNSIPTTAEQNGDFSALPVPIYDPATTTCSAGGLCTRQQFSYNGVLNVIPPGRISSISKYLQSFLPPPINGDLQNNYLGGLEPGTNQDRYLIKVDANLTQDDKIYGFGDWSNYSNPTLPPGGTNLPLPYSSSRYTIESTNVAGFGYTHIFGPHLVNELNAEYNRLIQGSVDPTAGEGWATKAGLTGVPPGLPTEAFPPVGFGGPNAPTAWAINGDTSEYKHTNNTYGLGDSLQWSHGKHNVVFGTQITYEQVGQDLISAISNFSFSNNETAGFGPTGTLLTSTGNGYASYLLGDVDSAALGAYAPNLTSVGLNDHDYSFFVQDDMKATSRLTLNLGLRYDIYTPMIEQKNRESWLNPTEPNPAVDGYPGALEFAGFGPYSCNCRTPVPTHFGNVGPRVGFAYAVNQKTVVRGAYGIFYVQGGASGGSAETLGTNQLGYSASPSFASLNGGISPAFNWNSGFPAYIQPPFIEPTLNTGFNTTTPSGGGITSYGDYFRASRAPYTQDWNLTIEREIARSVILDVSYSASVGHFLPTDIGLGIYSNQIQPKYLALGSLLLAPATPTNIASAQAIVPGIQLPYANFAGTIVQMLRPFPQYSGVNNIYPLNGSSSYNSLQVSAQKRFSHGLSFLLSYTFGKEIDTTGSNNQLANGSFSSGRTAYDASIERTVSVANIPNAFVASYVYDLPFGTGHALGGGNVVARTLTSDWQLAGIQTYRQGIPLGPFTGACNAPDTGGCYVSYNPNFSGHVRINGSYGSGYVKGTVRPYIDVDAFTNPAPYTFGNTPRTQPYGLHNPPYYDEDFSLSREFPAWERMKIRLQASAFNVFNRTELGSINTNITSASFGTIASQVNSARKLQFNAKFTF